VALAGAVLVLAALLRAFGRSSAGARSDADLDDVDAADPAAMFEAFGRQTEDCRRVAAGV
jgi:hypothetical protein